MTDKFVVINFEDLKEGDPVLFFGVHALRWNFSQMGEPAVAITSVEDTLQADYAALTQAAREFVDAFHAGGAYGEKIAKLAALLPQPEGGKEMR